MARLTRLMGKPTDSPAAGPARGHDDHPDTGPDHGRDRSGVGLHDVWSPGEDDSAPDALDTDPDTDPDADTDTDTDTDLYADPDDMDDMDDMDEADEPATAVPGSARPTEPLVSGSDAVPWGVQVTAAWSWRLLVIIGAVGAGLWVIAQIQLGILPLAVALLLSALLQPLAARLVRRGVPRALAAAIVLFGGLVVIGLLVWLVVYEFQNGYDDLSHQVSGGVNKIQNWLVNGPLKLSKSQIDSTFSSTRQSLTSNRARLTSGALGAASTAGHVLAGLALSLFATFFFLKDGRQIFQWLVRLFPRDARDRATGAGNQAWRTLIHYVRATVAVAAGDAIGIGLGAALLGVPLALPLAVLVFLGAFIPIIGGAGSGLVAVLVALVAKGPVTALILLGVVLLVQQVEGHVLQPLLLGRAVKVHPIAVVFGIATGVLLAGLAGALVAVPIVAVANTVAAYLSGGDRTATPTEPAT